MSDNLFSTSGCQLGNQLDAANMRISEVRGALERARSAVQTNPSVGPEFASLEKGVIDQIKQLSVSWPCPWGDPAPLAVEWKNIALRLDEFASRTGVFTISPEEELAILSANLPIPEPEPSFIRRNAVPLFIGGGVLVMSTLGMILLIKI